MEPRKNYQLRSLRQRLTLYLDCHAQRRLCRTVVRRMRRDGSALDLGRLTELLNIHLGLEPVQSARHARCNPTYHSRSYRSTASSCRQNTTLVIWDISNFFLQICLIFSSRKSCESRENFGASWKKFCEKYWAFPRQTAPKWHSTLFLQLETFLYPTRTSPPFIWPEQVQPLIQARTCLPALAQPGLAPVTKCFPRHSKKYLMFSLEGKTSQKCVWRCRATTESSCEAVRLSQHELQTCSIYFF